MFTGIVQGIAHVAAIAERPGLRSFELEFPPGFCTGLEIGASVACDGVCLTVTALPGADRACFDVMQQSLQLTTLAGLATTVALGGDGAGMEPRLRALVSEHGVFTRNEAIEHGYHDRAAIAALRSSASPVASFSSKARSIAQAGAAASRSRS